MDVPRLTHVWAVQDTQRKPPGPEGGDEPSAAPAGRKTLEAIGAADNIADALDLAGHEEQRTKVR